MKKQIFLYNKDIKKQKNKNKILVFLRPGTYWKRIDPKGKRKVSLNAPIVQWTSIVQSR